jgi:hypothetical protein
MFTIVDPEHERSARSHNDSYHLTRGDSFNNPAAAAATATVAAHRGGPPEARRSSSIELGDLLVDELSAHLQVRRQHRRLTESLKRPVLFFQVAVATHPLV